MDGEKKPEVKMERPRQRQIQRRKRSPTPPLLRPIAEYTEMELKVLKELKPHRRHYVLYDVTRKNNSASTLKALDMFCIHRFCIESDNLIKKITGSLFLRDIRCMERPLSGDEYERTGIGALDFAIGRMAHGQHYSLAGKTMIFELTTFTFTKELTEEKIRKRVKEFIQKEQPKNFFDKDLLMFPSFFKNGSFVTLVKYPQCGLVGYPNPTGKKCEILHVAAGGIKEFHELVGKYVPILLEEYSLHFHPTTPFGGVEHEDLVLPKLGDDKPYIILHIIEQILEAGYYFPDAIEIVDDHSSKRLLSLKEEISDYRLQMGEVFLEICQQKPTEVAKHAMAQRMKILGNEREQFKASTTDSDDDVLYVD